jgi:chromosome segregation ATPase
MSCSPCTLSPIPANSNENLSPSSQGCTGGRICRLIPALVALATCITGIALALVYKRTPLTAPFALGGGACLYLAYQSWKFTELQSMEVSAQQIASKTVKMGEEISRLEEEVSTLGKEITTLGKENKQLKKTVEDLEAKIVALHEQIQGLQKENETFAKNNAEQRIQIEDLEQLVAKLKEAEEGFETLLTDSTTLEEVRKGNLGTFQEELGKLQETRQEYGKVIDSLQALIKLLDEKVQKEIITELHKKIENHKEHLERLEKDILRLEGVEEGLQSSVDKLKGQIEELGRKLSRMETTAASYERSSVKLEKHIDRLVDAKAPPYIPE